MAGKGFDLSDYVDVAERIRMFRDKHPEGTIQSEVIAWPTEALPFIAVKAYAYRFVRDDKPGIGLAWEPVPGLTPYTKNSELMVAETSAWGRAIVAVGAADTKRGIASKNEVANRKTSTDWGEPVQTSAAGSNAARAEAGLVEPAPAVDVVGGPDKAGQGNGTGAVDLRADEPQRGPSASSEGSVETGHGEDSVSAPSPTTVHVHDWNPAPREGWVLCAGCGKAEKADRVKASA